MAYEFSLRRRIEFAETDMAGIVHFSNFYKFMEVTEAAFYRSLGFSVASKEMGIGWPRVHASCDFLAPLRFEDEIEIQLLVDDKRTRSIAYLFKIFRLGISTPLLAAQGRMVIVCVRPKAGGGMEACSIPDSVNKAIEIAPTEVKAVWTAQATKR